MRRFISVALATGVLLTATVAWAASGTDPSDTTRGIDILRSSVNRVETEDGKVRLVLKATAEDPLAIDEQEGSIFWALDTRGGGEADYEVYVFGDVNANVPTGPLYCLVQRPNGAQKHYVDVSQVENVATCRVPRYLLKIDKQIRWRLAGRLHGVIDRAPDVGWYGG